MQKLLDKMKHEKEDDFFFVLYKVGVKMIPILSVENSSVIQIFNPSLLQIHLSPPNKNLPVTETTTKTANMMRL